MGTNGSRKMTAIATAASTGRLAAFAQVLGMIATREPIPISHARVGNRKKLALGARLTMTMHSAKLAIARPAITFTRARPGMIINSSGAAT